MVSFLVWLACTGSPTIGAPWFKPWVSEVERSVPSLFFQETRPENQFCFEGTILTIRSPSGIGSVLIRPCKDWPPIRRVRFEYAPDRPMTNLEGFEVTVDDNVIQPNWEVSYGAVEWALPHDLLARTARLRLHWVDFYR